MSTNLDKSLDEILAGRKGGRGGRRGAAGPVGGVRKRPQRAAAVKATAAVTQTQPKAAKATPTAPASKGDASKIIVSNLPLDVKEQMIKEYFSKAIGHVKTCSLSYGPNGVSRGIATIVFSKNGDAEKAAATYNGVLVDRRPMKVELVLEPKVPGLESRVGAPNQVAAKGPKTVTKPKPATNTAPKAVNNARGRPGRRGGPAGRSGRPGRPKPKTEEELDAEMADYWDGSAPAAATGAADGAQYSNAAPGGDAMEDDQVL